MKDKNYRENVKYIVLNILLGIAVYFNSLKGEFHYDDFHVLRWVNVEFSISNLRFVSWLTFFVNSLSGESNVVFYHLTNLFIHICLGICIYFVVLFIIKKEKSCIPFFVSALFIVHPLTTEPVNYITARFAQLATLFCFLTLLFFILYAKSRKIIYVILTLVSFFMGMFSKEVGMFYAAGGVIIYSVYFIEWKKFIIDKKKMLVLAGGGVLLFLLVLFKFTGVVGRFKEPFLWRYFLVQNKVFLVKYFKLMILPIGLNANHYVVPLKHFLFDLGILLSIAINIAAVIYAVVIRKKNKLISFSIVWIYLLMFPYFFLTSDELAVEYRTYPAIFGFVLMLGYFLGNNIVKRIHQRIIFSIIVLLFGIITISRNKIWCDDMLLWQDAVKKSPQSARAHLNFGVAYKKKGIVDRALREYREALEINPDFVQAINNLGFIHYEKGQYDKAIEEFKRAIKINPKIEECHLNLGLVYYSKGLYEKAIEAYKETLKLNSKEYKAYSNLIAAYAQKGMFGEAVDTFNRGVKVYPGHAELYKNMGLVYKMMNDFARTLVCWKEYLRLYPDAPDVKLIENEISRISGNN